MEISGGRWDNLLRRLFPVKGGAVAPAIAPELVPTIQVQTFEPEMYRLKGERLLIGKGIAGPVAGQYAQVNLRNDSDDSLVIIESFLVSSGTAATGFQVRLGNNAVGTLTGIGGRDVRCGVVITAGSVSGAIRQSVNAGISGTHVGDIRINAANVTANGKLLCPFVLGPTHMLQIWNEAVNANIYVTFIWRERPFEIGENF